MARRPGRPKGGRLPEEVRDRFWDTLRTGVSIATAGRSVGVSRSGGWLWVREAGGVLPKTVNPALEARARTGTGPLSFTDRCRIEELVRARYYPAQIGRLLGRPTSTITREIARGTAPGHPYRAMIGQGRVEANRSRPKDRKLVPGTRLYDEVVARLAKRHSPEQIANRLVLDFPEDAEMRVSHETIYQAFYLQPRGHLAAEVGDALRTGRTRRKPHGRPSTAKGRRIRDMVNIADRPAEADDRAVPGHWEGDLILGAANLSAIATLVERTTRFTMLVHLPGDHTAATVAAAATEAIPRIPEVLRSSLTWDQGCEMALHTAITEATGLPIYFCDPHSPWQRPSNENTNGLLRQYFPKGTDLSLHGPGILDNVAAELNARPRKCLNWATPAEALDRLLSQPDNPVASTA